jgi:hypothetical protein
MRETTCPQCRGAARLIANPYYGAGLAVHRDLLVCEDCGFSGFAENESVQGEEAVAPPYEGVLRRILRRLGGG